MAPNVDTLEPRTPVTLHGYVERHDPSTGATSSPSARSARPTTTRDRSSTSG